MTNSVVFAKGLWERRLERKKGHPDDLAPGMLNSHDRCLTDDGEPLEGPTERGAARSASYAVHLSYRRILVKAATK